MVLRGRDDLRVTTGQTDPLRPVRLADEPEFGLGVLRVAPSACRVTGPAFDRRVEPRVMQVLVMLARQAGRTVSRDALIEACWNGRIVSDDAVARVVAQLRALARGLDPAPYAIDTVTKVGFRLIPAEAPLPPVPVSATKGRGRIAAAAGALALSVVAAGVWALSRQAPPGPADGRNGRIAVAAFEARKADPVLVGLSSSTPEAVARVLSKAGVAAILLSAAGPPAASDAEFLVLGSLDRDADRLLASVRIVDRKAGQVLWSEDFQQSAESPLPLVADVAGHVGSVLHCALEDRRSSRSPLSITALGLELNACSGLAAGRPETMLAASRRLVAVAPAFAAGHAMRGVAAGLTAQITDHSPGAAAALLAEADAAATRSLALDPRTAKAHVARALALGPAGDLLAREQALRRALALDPDLPMALGRYALLLRDVGRFREAAEMTARTASSGDPRAATPTPATALFLASTGDRSAADAELRRLRPVAPEAYAAARFTIAVWWDEPATALRVVRELGPRAATPAGRACAVRMLSEHAARRAAGTRGLPAECDGVMADWRIRMLARQGDIDAAYALMARPLPNSRGRTHMLFYPEMEAFRADARFMPLAARMGLVDYWRRSERWPDFCSDPGLPYDCRAVSARLAAARRPAP